MRSIRRMSTDPITILSAARMQGWWKMSPSLPQARREGRIILALARRGLLSRVWCHHQLSDRALVCGAPGAVVGIWYRGLPPEL